MFKNALGFASFSVVVFMGLILGLMYFMSSPPILEKKKIVSTEQNKTGVVKEAYLVQEDGSVLHEYLCAKSSVFKIIKDNNKTQFIENLEGISAVLEDAVNQGGKTVKQIRSFQAQGGVWDYAAQRLRANKAHVSIVESQKSGLKPIFQGHAEALDLQIENGKPKFTIVGFKAKLNKDKP
jgi:hypothetical protein